MSLQADSVTLSVDWPFLYAFLAIVDIRRRRHLDPVALPISGNDQYMAAGGSE